MKCIYYYMKYQLEFSSAENKNWNWPEENRSVNKLKSCLHTQVTTTSFLVKVIGTVSLSLLQLHLTQEWWQSLELTKFCSQGDLEGFSVLHTNWQKLLISNCDLEDNVTFGRQIASALLHRCCTSLPLMARDARSKWRQDAAHNQTPGFHHHTTLLLAHGSRTSGGHTYIQKHA